jgi:hypothetical protein
MAKTDAISLISLTVQETGWDFRFSYSIADPPQRDAVTSGKGRLALVLRQSKVALWGRCAAGLLRWQTGDMR